MLFHKKIEPRCAYCAKGTQLGEDTVACIKKGIVSFGFSCRSFRYDPLKRIPPRPVAPDFSKLEEKDFSL